MDDGEDIHTGGLSEIEDAVRILKDFPHVLVVGLRRAQADIGKISEGIDSMHDALDHAFSVERRGAADVAGDAANCSTANSDQ